MFPALSLFLCVYIFFILVHHPGSKIKRSDSSSSISSQSPLGWLLSFAPLARTLACGMASLGNCCLHECLESPNRSLTVRVDRWWNTALETVRGVRPRLRFFNNTYLAVCAARDQHVIVTHLGLITVP